MPLDNLFAMLGAPGTMSLLLGIVVFLGVPPAVAVLRATCPLPRLERSR